MYLEDKNVFASHIIEKCENQPDVLYSMCLADFVLHLIMSAKNQVIY